MAQFRNSGTPSLQELIDSYNDEIMRYSRMAQPAATEREKAEVEREKGEFDIERGITERQYWQGAGKQGQQRTATEREKAEVEREKGEFDIERGVTERQYWQGAGKQGQQRTATEREKAEVEREKGEFDIERGVTERQYWQGAGKQGQPNFSGRNNRPEPSEPLYPPHSHMPRPEPNEPLERPDGLLKYGNAAMRSITAAASSGGAVSSDGALPASSPSSPQEQWVLDLQQGLRDLERGLQELAEGQRELREGQLAYEQGIAERDRWRNMQRAAEGMSAQAMTSPSTATVQNGQIPASAPYFSPQNSSNQAFSAPAAPLAENGGNFSSSDGRIFPSRTGQITPADKPLPDLPDYPAAHSENSVDADGSGMGFLQVITYTARQATPIAGARVTVFRPSAKGDILISSGETNDDGKTPLLSLPTGTASGGGFAAPFSLYNVSVTAEGYMPRNYLPAQIFDGITALLPVEMVPLPDFSRGGM